MREGVEAYGGERGTSRLGYGRCQNPGAGGGAKEAGGEGTGPMLSPQLPSDQGSGFCGWDQGELELRRA